MTIKVSNEGIFDFLFGKKDEPASYKKLERLEGELSQVKTKEVLDIVAGRTKPSQEIIDRIVGFAEKHVAPAMVYRQNAQLFDILAKLVQLPNPEPYRVSEELEEVQTAKDAERIAKEFIRVMEPQLKLMRGAKQVVIGTATPDQLLADVTSHYQDNLKHIANCSYKNPSANETYLAASLAQDFGYPSGTWSNCEAPGLEELRDKNESLYEKLGEALEKIAEVADEFEMRWKLKHETRYGHYNPINDDLSFLVHARCALLDYVLKLKVSKEELVDGAEPVEYDTDALQIGALAELEHLSAGMEQRPIKCGKKMKKTLMSATLEELLDPAIPLAELDDLEEPKPESDAEGDSLCDAICVANESLSELELVVTAMEAANAAGNVAAYNVPLYQAVVDRAYSRLRLPRESISTESSDSVALSTEGVLDVIGKVGKALKEMIVKFISWLTGKFKRNLVREAKVEKLQKTIKVIQPKAWVETASFKATAPRIATMIGSSFKSLGEFESATTDWLKQAELWLADIMKIFHAIDDGFHHKDFEKAGVVIADKLSGCKQVAENFLGSTKPEEAKDGGVIVVERTGPLSRLDNFVKVTTTTADGEKSSYWTDLSRSLEYLNKRLGETKGELPAKIRSAVVEMLAISRKVGNAYYDVLIETIKALVEATKAGVAAAVQHNGQS